MLCGRRCMQFIFLHIGTIYYRETLKERMWEGLRQGGLTQTLVWVNVLFEQLRYTDGQASQNASKQRQGILDGGTRKLPAYRASKIPSFVSTNTVASGPMMESTWRTSHVKVPHATLDTVGSSRTTVTKALTKEECLGAQAKSMLAMTRNVRLWDNLLAARYRTSHVKATSVEI